MTGQEPQAANAKQKENAKPERLLDRQPFDRVTISAASGGDVIDTLLLELPTRQIPNPLPASGSLEVRRLSEPSTLYTLPWSSIAKIQFYEQLLLQEAVSLARTKQLDESYEYLRFLYKNYPDLEGIDAATAGYLRIDAQGAYAEQKYEETLTVLLALYDLDSKQRGLKRFVELVTDRMIEKHLAERDYKAARAVLDLLDQGFQKLNVSNVATWQAKFQQGAKRQLNTATRALEREQFSEAREALRRALAILPNAIGAMEMMAEIEMKSPQLVVAVDQLQAAAPLLLSHESRRIDQLLNPKLVSQIGFGAEGGDYTSPWAKLESDDAGLELDLSLYDNALEQGLTAEVVALELLRMADPNYEQFRPDFAALLSDIEIRRGTDVRVHWLRSHVRPESLLALPLRNLRSEVSTEQGYQLSSADEQNDTVVYRLAGANQSGPKTIIERYYENEEVVFSELLSGEVDLIARVPPWQLLRMQQTPGVVVSPYRLPTVHVLIPNYEKPLMGRREFRRALCYGIDREQILNDIILGGDRRAGFRVLSAPMPAGITITDPVGYAYNQGLQPRSYEPRLSAVLAAVARNSLAKLAAMKLKANSPDAEKQPDESSEEKPAKKMAESLVLVHPASPTATAACQTIKLQLGAIGIPVQLKLVPTADDVPVDYDLRYAELAIWEPIVDARRLLGPDGLAGHCSSPMSLALHDVDQSNNWQEVRDRLREVHEIAFNDLPVIPLWQTLDFFAHRESLQGIETTPVSLYQDVVKWRRALSGGRR